MISGRMLRRAKTILSLDGLRPTWEAIGPHVNSRANASNAMTGGVGQKWARVAENKSLRDAGRWVSTPFARFVRDALRASAPTSTMYAVRLVRVSARLLDSDNLEAAFKSLRDGIADAFEVSDLDPRVEWFADQEQAKPSGKHISRIEVYDLHPDRLGRPWRSQSTAGRPME